jgi:hypothetical protein
MKVILLLTLLSLLGSSYDLEVEVEGIPNTKGTIFIGLLN